MAYRHECKECKPRNLVDLSTPVHFWVNNGAVSTFAFPCFYCNADPFRDHINKSDLEPIDLTDEGYTNAFVVANNLPDDVEIPTAEITEGEVFEEFSSVDNVVRVYTDFNTVAAISSPVDIEITVFVDNSDDDDAEEVMRDVVATGIITILPGPVIPTT